jgi:hypothetical protein
LLRHSEYNGRLKSVTPLMEAALRWRADQRPGSAEMLRLRLGLALVRPARKDEKRCGYFPNWLRQRVEAVIWTLKNQLGLERHGGRVPRRAVGPASVSACSRSTPRSGTTGR